MKLRQLELFKETINQGLNISAAAESLHTSQPSISKQLHELADELGVELFQYSGKRLVGLTTTGEAIARVTDEVLSGVKRIEAIAADQQKGEAGRIVVATSRYGAHHSLADTIQRFATDHPDCDLVIHEDSTRAITRMVACGDADLGILSDTPSASNDLAHYAIDHWDLVGIALESHPLAGKQKIELSQIAEHPICTYERDSVSRQILERAFETNGIEARVAYAFSDSKLILRNVQNGLGFGIVANTALHPDQHANLVQFDLSEQLPRFTTWLVLHRRAHLRKMVYDFLELFDTNLNPLRIEEIKLAANPSHPR